MLNTRVLGPGQVGLGQQLLATGGADGTVRVWDPVTGSPVGEPLTGHTGQVFAVATFAGLEGRTLLATGGADGTVRIWAPTTGRLVYAIPVDVPVRALCPVDGGIAIGCDEGLLVIDLAP